jgi:NAD+ synthase (glutamine-hydrolysing)
MERSSDMVVVVGFVDSDGDIFNAAAVVYDKKLVGVYHKFYLPNYGVFDENRYFQAGTKYPIFNIYGVGIGISICEDIWNDVDYWKKRRYTNDPVKNRLKWEQLF